MAVALLIFIALILIRVPISLVLGITSISYILMGGNLTLLTTAPQRLYSGLESYGLLAIPLFMLAGELMNSGGITTRLVQFAKGFVGHFRGGLTYVNVVANMFLAAIIGSATAQIAMMSRVMVPSMEKEGYKREFAAATTAAAGLLGPIIPPSMMFIIYSVGSGASIGKMFLAGIVPGLILGLSFIVLIAIIGYRQSLPKSEKMSAKDRLNATVRVLPALLVPGIMIWGILSGVFTPTESAAIANLIALIVGFFFYRELSFKQIPGIILNTAITTATVTLLVAMANLFGWVLAFERIPQLIAESMVQLTSSPFMFLLLVNLFLLLVGMAFDGIAALIILVPIFTPILPQFGIDPIHFGVIICLNLTIGLLTPPVGAGLFIASSIANVKLEQLLKAIWPYLLASLITLLLVTYLPDLVMWIPRMGGQ
ncbi:TRAP transporter large permease [Brevibacillus ruminantium]|uniref:TRAP transporter large permease n=1 Tax=Brevibacillus ruminantium TaxID=2950604 RepID=A0ABY4WAZ2_9BACL|nr:TRAP transporter large permease [Brevibacillus ruminantium]USG64340.1 TRAP transporter large permease [Brevibacillus ruminantium]